MVRTQDEPKCVVCGGPMRLLDEDQQRWYCYKDDQAYFAKEDRWYPSKEELEEAARREELKQYHVLLVNQSDYSEMGENAKTLTVEEVSKLNETAYWGTSSASHAIRAFPMPLIHAALQERVNGKTIEDRIQKDPYTYPYTKSPALMLCRKCHVKVRMGQEYCEQCGAKIVIPIPNFLG